MQTGPFHWWERSRSLFAHVLGGWGYLVALGMPCPLIFLLVVVGVWVKDVLYVWGPVMGDFESILGAPKTLFFLPSRLCSFPPGHWSAFTFKDGHIITLHARVRSPWTFLTGVDFKEHAWWGIYWGALVHIQPNTSLWWGREGWNFYTLYRSL